jgi:hypothetical protein
MTFFDNFVTVIPLKNRLIEFFFMFGHEPKNLVRIIKIQELGQ